MSELNIVLESELLIEEIDKILEVRKNDWNYRRS